MAWYEIGTVGLTNGSANVVGVGTAWAGDIVYVGDAFLAPDGKLYEVQAVNSATQITLAKNYQGTTATGQAYSVIPTRQTTRELNTSVKNLVADIQNKVDPLPAFQTSVTASVAAHAGATNNPHGVTAAQVGAQPTNNPAFTGNMNLDGLLLGGIGAKSTNGVQDWNDPTNARSGSGPTLLQGSALNGPGPTDFFHSFCHEYSTRDGSGNLTQFAIEYNRTSARGTRQFVRTRLSNVWNNWSEIAGEYETGNWTPVLGGDGGATGQTYNTQIGRYVRVGQLVHVEGSIVLTNKGTFLGSHSAITGLPFPGFGGGLGQLSVGYFANLSVAKEHIGGYLNTSFIFLTSRSGFSQSVIGVPQSTWTDSTAFRFSACYMAT